MISNNTKNVEWTNDSETSYSGGNCSYFQIKELQKKNELFHSPFVVHAFYMWLIHLKYEDYVIISL